MNLPATTKHEYTHALDQLRGEPILATHTIGKLTITANHRRWTLTDGTNEFSGPVTKGPATREKIRTALNKWLKLSGLQ